MSTCGKITANVVIDCDNPMVAGNGDILTLINKEDWDEAVISRDPANDQLITGITLATGDIGYKFEGKNSSIEPTQKLVKLKYSEVYDHEVSCKAFKADAATKDQLEKLAAGKVVAIVENLHKGAGGSSAFEVYGDEIGLELQELERVLADADTQSAFSLVLRTPEIAKEAHLPASLFLTDYATTKAIVDGLVA